MKREYRILRDQKIVELRREGNSMRAIADELETTFGIVASVGGKYPSRDHIVPIAKGGEHSWENIQLAHFSCNTRKSDRLA